MDVIKFAHYGEERERIATEAELKIFEQIARISERDDLRLVNKSDQYVSAVIGDWDVARIKYTPRAKWLTFPLLESGTKKIRIESVEDVNDFADKINESVAIIEKYSPVH